VSGKSGQDHALFGLSKLSVWWLRLGINIERIKPGNSQQNGRHERMHLTLKNEATKPASENWLCHKLISYLINFQKPPFGQNKLFKEINSNNSFFRYMLYSTYLHRTIKNH
jgi:transposase InsO family protein